MGPKCYDVRSSAWITDQFLTDHIIIISNIHVNEKSSSKIFISYILIWSVKKYPVMPHNCGMDGICILSSLPADYTYSVHIAEVRTFCLFILARTFVWEGKRPVFIQLMTPVQ